MVLVSANLARAAHSFGWKLSSGFIINFGAVIDFCGYIICDACSSLFVVISYGGSTRHRYQFQSQCPGTTFVGTQFPLLFT